MKLRLTHNSIRIRIRKSELATLKDNLVIQEQVRFLGNEKPFKFSLNIRNSVKEVTANMAGCELMLSLPTKIATNWMASETVGIETHIDLGDDDTLHLLIEKDFPCLDRPNENKSDTFWELASENTDHSDKC